MNPKKIDIFTLPEPYPDEFLNSIIARYHCHSGNILEAKSRCELCGVPYEKKWISNVNHQTVFDTMRKYIEAHGPTIGTTAFQVCPSQRLHSNKFNVSDAVITLLDPEQSAQL